MTTRRRFTGEFKAKAVLEALRGDKTIQEIAARHKVHPNQVSTWKQRALEGMRRSSRRGRSGYEGTMRGRSGTCTRRPPRRRCCHLDGRQGPVYGQHLHRAPLALDEVRGRLRARALRRLPGPTGHRPMDGVLQHPKASLRPGWLHPGRGLPEGIAGGEANRAPPFACPSAGSTGTG